MTQRIIVGLRSAAERGAVLDGAARARVEFCTDLHAMARACGDSNVIGVVAEVGLASEKEFGAMVEALRRRRSPVPVLLRFDLNATGIRHLVRAAESMIDWRLSLRNFDGLVRDVEALASRLEPTSPRWMIASHLASRVPADVFGIVLASVIVGERRCSVRELSGHCRLSVRRLEERLAAAGLLPAKRLLMRILVLHTLWRYAVLKWPLKRLATESGFHSAEALAHHCRRAVGMTILGVARRGSFGDELERFGCDVTKATRAGSPSSALGLTGDAVGRRII